MKHIKFFEELSPDTYIDAGVKIKNKNQIKRGNTLISYGSDLKSNSYYNKNKIDTSIYKYNIFTDSYDGYPLKCKFIKCIIRPLFVDGDEVSLEECIDLDEHIEYMIAFIFETADGTLIAPFDFKIKLYSARFYNGVKKYLLVNDIILKQSEDYYEDDNVEFMCGIFSDRKSANMFLKEVVSKIPDDSDLPISNVVSLLHKPSSDLEKIYNMFTNIDIHYLYNEDDFSVLSKNKIITKHNK